MSNTVKIPMPVLLERLRLQTQIRRLIQEHGETLAWHIVSQAIERELKKLDTQPDHVLNSSTAINRTLL
jgi:hypothetical protein